MTGYFLLAKFRKREYPKEKETQREIHKSIFETGKCNSKYQQVTYRTQDFRKARLW